MPGRRTDIILSVYRVFSTVGLLVSGLLTACGSNPLTASAHGNASVESSSSYLTLADVATRVLGFESVTDWSVAQGSISAPTSSSDKFQGASSLQVPAQGYVVLQSTKLANSAVGAGSTFSCQIKLPTAQGNSYWLGSLQFFVDLPSANLYNAFVGQVNLAQPVGAWQTVSVSVPSDILAKIRDGGAYSDLVVKLALSVPQNAPAPYLLDDLRLCGSVGTNPSFCPTNDDCHVAAIDPISKVCVTRLANDVPCSTSNADTLGFEDPGRWSVSSGTVLMSTETTQGTAAQCDSISNKLHKHHQRRPHFPRVRAGCNRLGGGFLGRPVVTDDPAEPTVVRLVAIVPKLDVPWRV